MAEAAGDIGVLATALAEVCAPEQLPDVQAATMLAEGAARASAQPVAVNLVAGADEELLAAARNGVVLAAEARSKLAGGS